MQNMELLSRAYVLVSGANSPMSDQEYVHFQSSNLPNDPVLINTDSVRNCLLR